MERYDVVIEAANVWTDGQRDAFRKAVTEFAGVSDTGEAFGMDDADGLLVNVDGYVGFGGNVDEDADGFVFENLQAAEAFVNAISQTIRPAGLRAGIHRLD